MDRCLPAGEVTDGAWARVLAVNLTGPMSCAGRGAQEHARRGSGCVKEYPRDVRAERHTRQRDPARAVETGIPIGGEPSPLGYETFKLTLPGNPRQARPDQIAAGAAFLASDDASFVNGAVVVADGSWTAV